MTPEELETLIANARHFQYGTAYLTKDGQLRFKNRLGRKRKMVPWEVFGQTPTTVRPTVEDHRGQRFGYLVVIDMAELRTTPNGYRDPYWNCHCIETGKTAAYRAADLRNGAAWRDRSIHLTSHIATINGKDVSELDGRFHHPLYNLWRGIKNRCERVENINFQDYGARGIYLDDRWQDFWVFVADIGDRPSPDHQIERLDINGPYAPWNCCWLHRGLQPFSKRKSLHYPTIIALRAEGLSQRAIAKRLGCNQTGVSVALRHPLRDMIADFQANPPTAVRPDLKPPQEDVERKRQDPRLKKIRREWRELYADELA